MKKEKPLSVFGHYYRALGKRYFGLFVLEAILYGVSVYIMYVMYPVYYKDLIDGITGSGGLDVAIYYSFAIVVCVIFGLIFERVFEAIDIHIMSQGMKKVADYSVHLLTDHSYQFFTNNFAGSLVNKSKKFVGALDALASFIVREFLLAVVSVVGILVVLFQNSFILGMTALTWFVIFFYTLVAFTRIRIPLEKKKSETESRMTGVLSDIVTNVINLKLFSSRGTERRYFNAILEEEHLARYKAWDYANKSYTIQATISLLARTNLMFFSVFLWSYGDVSAGTIVLVLTYGSTLFSRLGSLGHAIRKFSDAYVNAHEFVEKLNQPIEIKDPENPEQPRMNKGFITFHNVSFAYGQGESIFSDFNLVILSGEKVGVVGTSGAGKSTITKLLLRFADVTSGSILIDGQDIRNITQDDLRSVISYVPQDPILFHRSLRENIGYGRPDATEEEIIDAAKKAHAHEFISSLKHGYDTLVGERGIKLSGGERQRVAIARAILKNSPILVLDEATSALDSVSEEYIQDALAELMKGKTVIVIAHRLSTIQKLDRIIVMEKGEIIEEGSHRSLLEKKGVYADFWNRQAGGFIK